MARLRLPKLQSFVPKAWRCLLCKSVAAEFGGFSNNKKNEGQSLSHGEKMKEQDVFDGRGIGVGEGVTVTGSKWASGEEKGEREEPTLHQSHRRLLPLCGRKLRPELSFTAEQIFLLL